MSIKVSTKEYIALMLREEGYDFATALEKTHKLLEELRARGPGTYKIHSRDSTFWVQIHAPEEKRNG